MGQEDESPGDVMWGHGGTGHGGLVTERGQKGHCGQGKSGGGGGVKVEQKWGGWGHRTGSRREWDNKGTPRREGGPEPLPGRKWWKWSWSRSHMTVLGGGEGWDPPPAPSPKWAMAQKRGRRATRRAAAGAVVPFVPLCASLASVQMHPQCVSVCECANSPPIVSPPKCECANSPPW